MFPLRPTRAFTLAEVLIFLALLAMAVLGLMSTQTYAMRCSQFNRLRHTASTILTSELSESESLLKRDFRLDAGHLRTDLPDYPGFASAVTSLYEPDTGSDERLRKITVWVYWTDPGASQENVVQAWTYVYHAP